MSKGHAVAAAIAVQLTIDGRWPMNRLDKKMQADYLYDKNTLAQFLRSVRTTLRSGTPKYYFKFDAAFVNKALTQNVAQLIGSVTKDAADTP